MSSVFRNSTANLKDLFINFSPDSALQAIVNSLDDIGRLTTTHEHVNLTAPYNVEPLTPVKQQFSLSLLVLPLKKVSNMAGFCSIRRYGNGVTDFGSASGGNGLGICLRCFLGVVGDHNYQWCGEKVLSAKPYDVCCIGGSDIAVTLPTEKKIQLYTVRDSDFICIANIQTGAKCWGIAVQ
jgi:hypothetical protein